MTRLYCKEVETKTKAPICKVFFSYQGEALYTGLPQIFVRFFGCNIRCGYCDTRYSNKISKNAVWFSEDNLIKKIKNIYSANKNRFVFGNPSISLTGGEPLIHINFLEKVIYKLKKLKFDIYLETNGILHKELKKIIDCCDIISMDFKLKSDCGSNFWQQHKEFLKIAVKSKKETFVKIVVTNKTKLREILKGLKVIKSVSKKVPLVLQISTSKNMPRISDVYKFFSISKKNLENVSLMPQMHKIYKIM
jgi:organic radical activating enzyme